MIGYTIIQRHSRFRSSLVILGILFVLMACASPASVPSAPAAESAAQPAAGEVARERTFIIGRHPGAQIADPTNANPYFSGFISDGLHNAMIESLAYLNIFDGKITPWLAESWESNVDFTEVTIKVHSGVEWSDGQPFTANDIVFTINMLKNNPMLAYSADMQKWVKEVTAIDDHTVRFVLTAPNPRFFMEYFSVHFWGAVRIVPEHIWKDQDPVKFTNFDLAKGWPVFTGPYRLAKVSETEVILDRRDDWWGKKSGFKELPGAERIIYIDPGTTDRLVAMLTQNELDSAMSISAGPYESAAAQNPTLVAFTKERPYGYVDACPFGMTYNTARTPWSDPDVRWAVNYAIDKATYLRLAQEDIVGQDWLTPFIYPRYGPLETLVEKNKDLFAQYDVLTYDPEKAKQLLESKGYKTGADGIRSGPDGQRMQATIIWVPTAYVEFAAPVESIVQNLKAIGIDTVQKQLNWGAWDEQRTLGDFDLSLEWVCGSIADPWKTLDIFNVRWVVPVGEKSNQGLPVRWAGKTAETYSEVVDQIATLAPEDAKIEPLVRQAMEYFLRELPYAPFHQLPRIIPYNTTYWSGFPTSDNPYVIPAPFWMSSMQVLVNLRPTK